MENIIAEKFIPKKSLISALTPGFLRKDELKVFLDEARKIGLQVWGYDKSNTYEVADFGRLPDSPDVEYARLFTKPIELQLSLFQLETQDCKEIDLTVKVLCIIANPASFLHKWKDRLDTETENCIEKFVLEHRVSIEVQPLFRDEIQNRTYKQTIPENNSPGSWTTLFRPVEELGLEFRSITDVECVCAEEANRQALDKRRREYAERQKLEKLNDDYAIATKKRELEDKEQIQKIEDDHQLRHAERQAKLKAHDLLASENLRLAQLRIERDRLKIKEEIAVIRDQAEERERIQRERRSIEEQLTQVQVYIQQYQKENLAMLQEIREMLENGKEVSESLLNNLFGRSQEMLAKLIEREETSESIRLRFRRLIERGKYAEVLPRVMAALSRDVGCHTDNEILIKQKLDFEFVSPKSGYVTIINLGTSGRFWLHVPNKHVSIDQAKINANQKYSVPGNDLLPQAKLNANNLDYKETGPPGWDEIIIIVTPTPLIREIDVFKTSAGNPLALISLDRMAELVTELELDAIPSNAVALGALGLSVRELTHLK